jgi:hypothetical protein
MPEMPMTDPEMPRPRRKWGLIVAAVVIVPLLLFSLYAGLTLKWSYSDGVRAGILQKFSAKGWVCKTWEGELAMTTVPGVAPTLWTFTVRDNTVARQIEAALGKRVVLHYREHRGVPTSCFGDTPYFVDSVAVSPP